VQRFWTVLISILAQKIGKTTLNLSPYKGN